MKLSDVTGGTADAPKVTKLSELPPVTGPSIPQRIGTGMLDPAYGMLQLGARMPTGAEGVPFAPEGEPSLQERTQAVDEAIRKREQGIQAERTAAGQTGTDWWRVLGNVISPPNLALAAVPGGAATLPARVGLGAVTGAASAATEPATQGDFWSEKLKQAVLGLGVGAAVPAAATGASRAIAPVLRPDAQRLVEAGVSLTPGQMAGSWLRRPEEAAKSLPVLGSFIRGSEGRGIESFNTSVINQTLEPIGARLPKGMKAGREAIDYAATQYNNAYDQLLPTMRFSVDPDFASGMTNLRQLAAEMPPGQATQFDTIIKNRLFQRLGAQGNMDGQTLKQVESELGYLAGSYRHSSDAAQQQLASALDETRHLIRQALARQNPHAQEQLKNINAGYAMLTRIENASGRRLGSQGVFTPMDLLSAVRAGDQSVRHRDFAHGDALMQQFAETAQRVLSKDLPDSGTTERALWDAVIRGFTGLGLLGGAATHPAGIGIGAPAAIGTMIAPYTRVGGEAVRRYASPDKWRAGAGDVVENLGLSGSPAAATAATLGLR